MSTADPPPSSATTEVKNTSKSKMPTSTTATVDGMTGTTTVDFVKDTDTPVDSVDESVEDRQFDKGIEFLLSCLGMSVGLGNVWRFPTRAYENGGSAFLIPYILCALLFGLPGVYLEFALGQYNQKSPPFVYRRIMPVLEGFGWVQATLACVVGVYFMLIMSWISVYIFNVVIGNTENFSKCDNAWNNAATCFNVPAQKLCKGPNPPGWNKTGPIPKNLIYMEGQCHSEDDYTNVNLTVATEQFFENYLIRASPGGMLDINSINWPVFISMAVCWVITTILILKGMKLIGKISYFTVILPYIIVLVLFIRGITLEGAGDGLLFFLAKPDFNALLSYETWTAALTQLCFSLSIGFGGLMNIAAYNKKNYNCFRDSMFLIMGDTTMSLVGGAAVFSTLGFLAKQRGVPISKVISSGPSLAFVAYPDAMNQMPFPWLWSFLFFVMLFLLGLSTEMVIVEVMCSCLQDRFKSLRKKRLLVVPGLCFFLFCTGIILTTDAGFYWFALFDEYGSGFGAMIVMTATSIIVSYLYGFKNFKADLNEMLGEGKGWTKYFGHASPYYTMNWMVVCPLFGFILMVLTGWRSYPYQDKPDLYPLIFDIGGWTLALVPFLTIPFCAFLSYRQFKREGVPAKGLFMLQKQHPSYSRISKTWSEKKREIGMQLPRTEPGSDDVMPESEQSTTGSDMGSVEVGSVEV